MKAKAKEKGILLDALLLMLDSSSPTAAKKLIKAGRVTIGGRLAARADAEVRKGQVIEIRPVLKGSDRHKVRSQPRLPFEIVYDDKDLIVVDKPAGILSIATAKERMKTLYRMVSDFLKERDGPDVRVFIVHRLDRDVSGLMVIAKNEPAKRKLQKAWATSEKIYHAVVDGAPPEKEGTIKNHLCENRAHRVYQCPAEFEGAQEAVTHYRLLKRGEKRSSVEVRLGTGRKHQIRVHLSGIGCPIVGDDVYGAGRVGISGIALHAHSLSFDHPTSGRRIKLRSATPKRMSALV